MLTDEVLERKNASNQRYVFCWVSISRIGCFYKPLRLTSQRELGGCRRISFGVSIFLTYGLDMLVKHIGLSCIWCSRTYISSRLIRRGT